MSFCKNATAPSRGRLTIAPPDVWSRPWGAPSKPTPVLSLPFQLRTTITLLGALSSTVSTTPVTVDSSTVSLPTRSEKVIAPSRIGPSAPQTSRCWIARLDLEVQAKIKKEAQKEPRQEMLL